MSVRRLARAQGWGRVAALTVSVGLLATVLPGPVASGASGNEQSDPQAKPTIVLVHGAFADASGWAGVITRLQARGYTVYAPANPLRNLKGDADYISAFLSTIPGKIVLVGHSYGGAVITNAATGNPNVKALVYIDAFALEEGEKVVDAIGLGGGESHLGEHIVARPYPGAPEGDGDGYIDPAWFHRLFCKDLPRKEAAVLAASQRPAALFTLGEPSGVPAWKTIPSWYLVGTKDRTLPPEAQRFMADRAGSTTVEVAASHVSMISHPDEATDLILDAATR